MPAMPLCECLFLIDFSHIRLSHSRKFTHLACRIMPSIRSLPSPNVNPSEMPFLSREWLDGNLERPERPVNPVPPHDAGTILPVGSFDRLVASFQNFHVGASISASNSGTTIEEVSSSGSDSGLVKLGRVE